MTLRVQHITGLFLLLLAAAALQAQSVRRSGNTVQPTLHEQLEALHVRMAGGAAEVLVGINDLMPAVRSSSDPTLLAHALCVRGDVQRAMGRFDQGLDDLARAYAIADSLDDDTLRVNALVTMTSLHLDMSAFDKAESRIWEALALAVPIQHPKLATINLDIGVLHDIAGRIDSALHYYHRAEMLALAARDSSTLAAVYHDMGVLYAYQGDLPNSERYEFKALDMLPQDISHDMRAKILISIGSFYAHLRMYDKALPLLEECRKEALRMKAGHVLRAYHQVMAAMYGEQGDTLRTFLELERYSAVRDSLESMYRAKTLADAEARFGLTKVEKELAITRARAEATALRAQRSRIAWGGLMLIIALSSVLTFSFYRQARLKRQAARALERDKERLSEENELLHQENLMARFETLKSQIDPHFLFNAMNTLYTLVETEPAKAREFIASFSALYRKVLGSRDRLIVPVEEELELVRHYLFLQRIRFGDSLLVEVQVPATTKGFLPPFTLQILLENAVKHNVISAARPLHIQVGVEGDRLVVRNDLRLRQHQAPGTGTGLENIRRRYAMLGAPEPTFAVSESHYTASVPILSQQP